jgi:hypothetical protein
LRKADLSSKIKDIAKINGLQTGAHFFWQNGLGHAGNLLADEHGLSVTE